MPWLRWQRQNPATRLNMSSFCPCWTSLPFIFCAAPLLASFRSPVICPSCPSHAVQQTFFSDPSLSQELRQASKRRRRLDPEAGPQALGDVQGSAYKRRCLLKPKAVSNPRQLPTIRLQPCSQASLGLSLSKTSMPGRGCHDRDPAEISASLSLSSQGCGLQSRVLRFSYSLCLRTKISKLMPSQPRQPGAFSTLT